VPYTHSQPPRIVLPQRVISPERMPEVVENLLVEDRYGAASAAKSGD